MENCIQFVIEDERAVVPTKAHPTDIGHDLTAIDVYKKISKRVILFETGVAVCPPPGFYIEIVPRSSISKTGYMLANSVGIIDPDYNATLKIALIKIDDDIPDIKLPFTRCQIVLRRAEYADMKQVKNIVKTERGSGGFGSTDKVVESSFKVKHQFKGEHGKLREIKILGLPPNTSKKDVYRWEWIQNGSTPIPLTCISSKGSTRIFEDGHLIFNNENASLNYKNKVYKFVV